MSASLCYFSIHLPLGQFCCQLVKAFQHYSLYAAHTEGIRNNSTAGRRKIKEKNTRKNGKKR
jgi:hypothetical protein